MIADFTRTRCVGALFALLAASCNQSSAPEPEWPAGTALVLDGNAIAAQEIDRHTPALGAIDPAYSRDHRRRLILTRFTLPLVHGRDLAEPAAREAARRAARDSREALVAEDAQGPPTPAITGNWRALGLGLWLAARELEVGEWSEVVELPGHYVLVKLVDRDGNTYGGMEEFEVRVEDFPYVDAPGNLGESLLETELEIIDPAWDHVVPGAWKHRLSGDSRP